MGDSPADIRLALAMWRGRSGREAKRAPRHRVGVVTTGVEIPVRVSIEQSEGGGIDIALVDVPAFGNCLYHAVWSSAERRGVPNPFGVRGTAHVYTLRLMVAQQVVSLMSSGVLSEEHSALEVGDLVAMPDQYLKYSGQVPQMAMALMLKRTIVMLSSDGISSVCPHNFEELVGEVECQPPIVIYHCQADAVQDVVTLRQRNHYCAVNYDCSLDPVFQQLVAQFRRNAEAVSIDMTGTSPRSEQVDSRGSHDMPVPVGDAPSAAAKRQSEETGKDGAEKTPKLRRIHRSGDASAESADPKMPNVGASSGNGLAPILSDLSHRATTLRQVTEPELIALTASQQYTRCPKLALLFFHCCSNDPRAYVFNNNRLRGDVDNDSVHRLESVLEGPVTPAAVGHAQEEVNLRSSSNTTLTACASCCEIQTGRKDDRRFPIASLPKSFELNEKEHQAVSSFPEQIRSTYVQVFESQGKFYHLNPDLVVDDNAIVLCNKCQDDPRQYKYSIASGHDYGRVGTLPELNDISSSCVSPMRCFGIELSLPGKHSTGHSICFPSDGPSKCATVLPHLHINESVRVTFVGPREEWRVKKKQFAKLYDLTVDDVYTWLQILQLTHSGFRERNIVVEDTPERREQLAMVGEEIKASVAFENCVIDSKDEADEDGTQEQSPDILLTASAVLKPVSDEVGRNGSTRIIDSLLEVVSSNQESARTNTIIPVSREDDPVVEWTDNGKMIACAFPQLFLLGGHFLPKGTWPKDLISHLMSYYDGRFERDTKFVALLFNQLQRHAATRRAAKVGISNTASLKRLGSLVSSDQFRERLLEAKSNPGSAKTKRLNASLLRILSLVGSCVPFSPFEKASARPKIAALRYRYGVPQHWVTIAPPEHDDLMLHRIAMIRSQRAWNQPNSPFCSNQCTFDDFPEEVRVSARSRLAIANKYPALAAQVFQRCMVTVFEDVVSCSPKASVKLSKHYGERMHGPFGKVAAHCYVVEPQKDGRLHAHALLYNSTYTPELLTRIACSERLRARAAEWLSSVSCTKLQASIHEWRSSTLDKNNKFPRAFELQFPPAGDDVDAFFHECEKLMATTNIHTHSPTCRKTARGKYMCRLARPAGVQNSATCPLLITREMTGSLAKGKRPVVSGRELDEHISEVIDSGIDYRGGHLFRKQLPGPVVWELHRPETDKFVVETNRALAGLSRSHTNSSIINGEDAGDVVEQYSQNYMTKDEPSLKEGIPVLLSAIDHIKAYPSRADDRDSDIRKGKYAATRTVNAFTGAHEWSHSIMVHAICGNQSFTSSDSFWYVFPHAFVNRLAKHPTQNDANQQHDPLPTRDDEGVSEDEGIDHELAQLVAMANNDSHHQDSCSVAGRVGGTRSYKIGDAIVFLSQVDSYIHRGKHFEDYSPVEFECIVDVLPVRADPEARFGRKRRVGFEFDPSHPLHGHYLGFLRAKQHTPILGGAPPPIWKPANKQAREATSKYLLASFTNWRGDQLQFPFTERGLFELCEQWDHSNAPLISRQRYRYIRNVLKRGYRNSRSEDITTDWRNRNVDLWENYKLSNQPQRTRGQQYDQEDAEKDGRFHGAIDLFGLTQSVVTGNSRKRDQLRAIRLRFESIMDPGSARSEARVSPTFERSDPVSHGFFTDHHENRTPLRVVAARLSTLTQPHTIGDANHPHPSGDGGPQGHFATEDVSQSRDMSVLSPEQRQVLESVLSGINSTATSGKQTRTMLHGPGGTGKSFLVRIITSEVERRGYEVVSTCTTGAGACQLTNGYTFHSAFKVRTNLLSDDSFEHLKLLFTPKVKLVVVDEVSMLKPELLVKLDERLKKLYNPGVDFGGISILLVGDFFQLPVVRGTSLCALMYIPSPNTVQARAQVLFKGFKVLFLTEQQRANQCQQQQELLRGFRSLPATYPVGSDWTIMEQSAYHPVTGNALQHIVNPLDAADVFADTTWRDNSVILVTGNADRALFNTCMATLMAKRAGRLLFRWRKTLSTTDDHILQIQDLLYNEEERPQLFGYFVKDGIGQVLDNSNGNVSMGVANGSKCRYHSIAWDDLGKTATVIKLIEDRLRTDETIVDLPFPPEFINITILDRNNRPIPRTAWPSTDNLAGPADGDTVVVPIGIVKSTADKFKIKIAESVHHPKLTIHFDQHAVDLAMALTVWKAQGSTFDRVILHPEGSMYSPAWQFEHIYVALSRVRAAAHLRCLPLSHAFDRSKLQELRPKVDTVKWMMDINEHGYWNDRNQPT